MQRTRDKVWLHGKALGREPLIFAVRGTRFEAPTNVGWLKGGVFDAQGIGAYPTVKLMKKLGVLPHEQHELVESCVRLLLELPCT